MLKRFGMVASVLALLALALAGCKNGMLGEDEATVNGLRDAGGRTAFVTITNFAGSGKMRTIAPDLIDLAASAGDYVFVATGTNNRVEMDAAIVPVDGASGRVDLAGLNPGTWTITITAYSKDKLNAVGGVDLADVTQVMAQKATSAVLSGTGYVDLRNSSSDVKITLTPAGMGTKGNVQVNFKLHTDDQTKIQQSNYNVHIALYDGSSIVGTNQDVSTAARQSVDIAYPQTEVNVGMYVIKVTISDPAPSSNLGPWVWSDTLYVEGNRDTNPGTPIQLSKLIGESPAVPEKFAVYYNTDKIDSKTGNYVATFAWDRKSYNEQGFELQIYDITDKYNYTGADMQYGGQAFTSAEDLWTNVNQDADKDTKGLKTKETMGTDVEYPKYTGVGNLMAASTYVDYTLQTGHVYVFRLRAANAAGKSDWVYFGNVDPAVRATTLEGAGPNQLNKQLALFTEKVASVYTVTYDLQNAFVLAQNGGNLVNTAISSAVATEMYNPTTPYTIPYLPGANYLLFVTGATGTADNLNDKYVPGWTGWVDAYNNAVQFDDARSTYDKWGNLTLKTIGGASGKSLMIDIISSGSFADLIQNGDKVLLQVAATDTAPAWTTNEVFTSYTQDVKTTRDGFGKVNTKFALNIDTDLTKSTRYLHFAVGQEDGGVMVAGKLKTATDIDVTIDKVEFFLEENGKETIRGLGTLAGGVVDLNGLPSGDYTLRIKAYNTYGYVSTFQEPITIKYDTDTVQ